MAEAEVGQVVFLLCFQYSFPFDVKPYRLVDQKSAFQSFQVVINRFGTQLSPLAFQKVRDGLGGKGISDVIHQIEDDALQQRRIPYLISGNDIFEENGIVNVMQILHDPGFLPLHLVNAR